LLVNDIAVIEESHYWMVTSHYSHVSWLWWIYILIKGQDATNKPPATRASLSDTMRLLLHVGNRRQG
jgi:hypothetical protein